VVEGPLEPVGCDVLGVWFGDGGGPPLRRRAQPRRPAPRHPRRDAGSIDLATALDNTTASKVSAAGTTPATRTLTVVSEARPLAVVSEARTLAVEAEDRTAPVLSEARATVVDRESRRLTSPADIRILTGVLAGRRHPFHQGPKARLDYAFNWSTWLGAGERSAATC
jgi:hypothetical protein